MNSEPIKWADYLEICVGMMGMRPYDFWDLSPQEMYRAITGFKNFNSSEDSSPMTKDSLEEMMELYPD
jgi:uncharacterized phage protein (TIGR02216 family)|tara:strand:+ start:356 stop:559 length:204 start_codon:yes stop_codon:yes gene_type:complete